jgi:endonuclease/exonuclease/phosphatase family metal-dependent hydrolase
MKIATWNIERPKEKTKRNQAIIDCLGKINADIVVLTETNDYIKLAGNYDCYHSSKLDSTYYYDGETRVSIYSKYGLIRQFETFRSDTSICVQLNTPYGDLAVYGTVIGIYGNRNKNFIEDLDQQLLDFDKIAKLGNICIGGDLNISFSDNYYFTKEGRLKLNTSCAKLNLFNLTANIAENIDHIILTKTFVGERNITTETWNMDKMLSDHIGVAVEIGL